jgi:hypothetical protein
MGILLGSFILMIAQNAEVCVVKCFRILTSYIGSAGRVRGSEVVLYHFVMRLYMNSYIRCSPNKYLNYILRWRRQS